MCGISGICNYFGTSRISPDILNRMNGALIHRGPDESGLYLDDYVGLAHTRLSIIDLSSGTQPIHNEDKTLWIVSNGEIFNYPELKQELVKKGHQFYTSSDTEVVLHLYEDGGKNSLDLLNGQFAFAIWHSDKKELFLARDRVGICPLYYSVQKDAFIFSSEIKSIFMLDLPNRSIDPEALDQIFTFWTTLPGKTAFQGINELPPGHYLSVRSGEISVRKYWEIPFFSPEEQLCDPVEYLSEEIGELIRDAVRLRLRADVPVGSYLSGGLDSSGITALVKREFDNELMTFGIRFEEKEFDEGKYQHQVVSHLNVKHTEVMASNEKISQTFSDVVWHCEKPLLRTAPIPLYLLSREVNRRGFKVVLTGEGADEIFGGYNIFREAKVRAFWARQPDSHVRPRLFEKLYPYIFQDYRLKKSLHSFFGYGLDRVEDPLYSHLVRWQNTSRIKTFFSDDFKDSIGRYCGIDEVRDLLPGGFNKWDYLSKAQYLEIALFMSNYLLSSQGDRVSMAHAVEARPPYLDHRLIEFMGRVPSKLKISGLKEKYLLKKIFEGMVPRVTIDRDKHPYRAPIGRSLMNGYSSYLKEMLSEDSVKAAGLFDVGKVRRLLKKAEKMGNPSEVESMALVGILSSQILYDRFIFQFPCKKSNEVSPKIFIDKRSILR
ncbi:MAG: asparagine synthase (glutamine-hydrolyzing) [Candidatus Dadabacteria bacterium]|nr:asparagine synthase (glutamine-hydrolyzing) [Candidatus Dadabacteria bacterium]